MAKRTFKPGDRVRDTEGRTHTVQLVKGVQIWVGCNTWIHPTKLVLVGAAKRRS